MAKTGLGLTDTLQGTPERDEIDEMFDALVDNPGKNCALEDIDPSKPGWEIFLHFEQADPRIIGSSAHEDFLTFRHFAKLGIATAEYKEGTRTLVLSYLPGCSEEEFDPHHLEIMKRYNPQGKADPQHQRKREIAQKNHPETAVDPAPKTQPSPQTVDAADIDPVRSSARDSASEILAAVSKGMAQKPPVIYEIKAESPFTGSAAEPEEKLKVPDDLLITLPVEGPDLEDILEATSCANLDELLGRLEAIAEEEELQFEAGEVDGLYIVNIYKNPSVEYSKPMDRHNMAFILKLPCEKIPTVGIPG